MAGHTVLELNQTSRPVQRVPLCCSTRRSDFADTRQMHPFAGSLYVRYVVLRVRAQISGRSAGADR